MSVLAKSLLSARWALRRNLLGVRVGMPDSEFYARYWEAECRRLAARIIGAGVA